MLKMNKVIIYLSQPYSLVGSNRCQISISKNHNLLKDYRYICIMECIEPVILEPNIKTQLANKFKFVENEYYEGDEKDILETFNKIVIEHNESFNMYKNLEQIDTDDSKTYYYSFNEIKKEFSNYNEDIEFGGTKQLIKIYINLHHQKDKIKYDDYIINFKYIRDRQMREDNLYLSNINDYEYIKKIIDKKIIQNANIYNLNDKVFQNKINKYKKIYNNVILLEETYEQIIKKQQINLLEKNTIDYLFRVDCLINNIPSCSYYHNTYLFYPFGEQNKITICAFNAKYYDKLYLRKYLPYCIEFNKITKNYYVINRDYEYIGYDNIKCLSVIENDIDKNQNDLGWSRIFLFNDGNPPWNNKTNFTNYIKKYNQVKKTLNKLNNNIDVFLFDL